MDYIQLYKNVIKDLKKVKGGKSEKFDEIFLLTCLLIYDMSCSGKNLDLILTLLNEFDYNKNFEGGK